MRFFPRLLWFGVLLGIVATIGLGIARDRWERGNRLVELAARAADVWEVARAQDLSFLDVLKTLRQAGLQGLVLSPLDVPELRERFFPYRRGSDGAWISLQDVKQLIAQGGRLYWELDAWVPAVKFPHYLEALLSVGPRGLLVSHPLALGLRDPAVWGDQTGDVRLGLDEFSDLPDSDWVRALRRRGFLGFVRVHRLSREERAALSDRAFIARELRAVRERNVRLLELRALRLDQLGRDAVALRAELQRAGFSIGLPRVSPPFSPAPWALGALWLGLISLLALTVSIVAQRSPQYTPHSQFWVLTGWGFGAMAGLLALILAGESARIVFAWLTATAVPVAAFVWLSGRLPRGPSRVGGLRFWLTLSAASLLGGGMAAGFLSEDVYFLKIAVLPGVKAALIAPIAAGIAFAFSARGLRDIRPLDVGVWLGVGLLLALVVLRSGNVSDWPFLDAERLVRDGLEGLFGVRPRFKEFLIGHPALIVWASLGDRRWRPAALGWLAIGLLGQVSIINSFLHLHTPVAITLLRTLYGLALGGLIGWLVQTLLFYVYRLFPRPAVH